MKNIASFGFLTLSGLLINNAFAAPPSQLQPSIDRGQVEIIKEFKVSDHLNGFVIKNAGQLDMLFSTSDGLLIMGDLIGKEGQSLRAKLEEEHFPKKDFSKLYKEISSVDKSRLVIQGNPKNKPVAYIYADMNCGFCKVLHKAVLPYIEKHPDLTIAWVPVGMLSADSLGKALYVLDSDNKSEAMDAMLKGSYPQDYKPSEKSVELAKQNRLMMMEMGYGGTPSGLYADSTGEPMEIRGMVSLTELATLLGKPKIANTDPSLAQFDR